LRDKRQGRTHDYEKRAGEIEYAVVVTPDGAGAWTREDLWNAAEAAEKRRDGRTAREWDVALPAELNQSQRSELAIGFAGALVARYDCAVDLTIRGPGKTNDARRVRVYRRSNRELRFVTLKRYDDHCMYVRTIIGAGGAKRWMVMADKQPVMAFIAPRLADEVCQSIAAFNGWVEIGGAQVGRDESVLLRWLSKKVLLAAVGSFILLIVYGILSRTGQ